MKNRIQAALSRANDKTKGLSAEELSELSQEAYKGINPPMDPRRGAEIVLLPILWRSYLENTIYLTFLVAIIIIFSFFSPEIRVLAGIGFGAWLGQMTTLVGVWLERKKTVPWPETRRMTGEESKASAEVFWEEFEK